MFSPRTGPDAAARAFPFKDPNPSTDWLRPWPAVISGNPTFEHTSTSYIERQNLTMRMFMRRFTRLQNGFSKKVENHEHAVAIHYMYYNFARIHQSLRVTPAMEAGISDHVWNLNELINLIH
jgi:hypothetical protein